MLLPLGLAGIPASRVMIQVRRSGLISRDELTRRTGLSASSVARTVTALAQAGLLRERSGRVAEGAVGRPTIPVEIDTRHITTVSCHVGRRSITVALGDLAGGVVDQTHFPYRGEPAADLTRRVAARVTGLLAANPGRLVVAAGLVAPWSDIQVDRGELTDHLSSALGMPVATDEFVAAMVEAESLARPEDWHGSTLYVYARDTFGFALAHQDNNGIAIASVGRLSHFPTGGASQCRCGRTGCLEAVASDQALAGAAQAAGLTDRPDLELVRALAREGNERARRLLGRRAERIGRIAGLVRDMVNPDRIVLCGQAYSADPWLHDRILAAFDAQSTGSGSIDITFAKLSREVQAVAAGTVALRAVYAQPLDGPYRRTDSAVCAIA